MPKQQVLRKTLIHDQVGSVRAPAIKLPEGSHEFGKEIAKDPENAGQGVWNFILISPLLI